MIPTLLDRSPVNLYPTISQKGSYDAIKLRMNFLAYADGSNSLFDIAKIIDAPLQAVLAEADLLGQHHLVTFSHSKG